MVFEGDVKKISQTREPIPKDPSHFSQAILVITQQQRGERTAAVKGRRDTEPVTHCLKKAGLRRNGASGEGNRGQDLPGDDGC